MANFMLNRNQLSMIKLPPIRSFTHVVEALEPGLIMSHGAYAFPGVREAAIVTPNNSFWLTSLKRKGTVIGVVLASVVCLLLIILLIVFV